MWVDETGIFPGIHCKATLRLLNAPNRQKNVKMLFSIPGSPTREQLNTYALAQVLGVTPFKLTIGHRDVLDQSDSMMLDNWGKYAYSRFYCASRVLPNALAFDSLITCYLQRKHSWKDQSLRLPCRSGNTKNRLRLQFWCDYHWRTAFMSKTHIGASRICFSGALSGQCFVCCVNFMKIYLIHVSSY